MGLTPVYGFPYPSGTDSPNGPSQIQSLATAVEGKFVTSDAAIAVALAAANARSQGLVLSVSNTTAIGSITSAETVTDQGSFTAVAGRRYLALARFCAYDTVAADQIEAKIRWKAGATVDATGTIVDSLLEGFKGSSVRETFALFGTTISVPSGTVSFGITVVRGTGSGTITRDGAANNPTRLLVFDMGNV